MRRARAAGILSRRMARRTIIAFALLLSSGFAFGFEFGAQAQEEECRTARRAVETTIPISGARDIPLNILLRGRYPAGYLTEYGAEIELYDAEGAPVAGETMELSDRLLYFIPSEELLPFSEYRAVFSGVDADLEVSFLTSGAIDLRAPGPPVILSTESGSTEGRCGAAEELTRVGVLFEAADDDTSISSIEYLLYRTRGPALEAPELLARASQAVLPGETQTVGALLIDEKAEGRSCFVIVAEDALLRRSVSEPRCFGPKSGNHAFDGLCASTGSSGEAASLWLPILLAFALIHWRARLRARPGG